MSKYLLRMLVKTTRWKIVWRCHRFIKQLICQFLEKLLRLTQWRRSGIFWRKSIKGLIEFNKIIWWRWKGSLNLWQWRILNSLSHLFLICQILKMRWNSINMTSLLEHVSQHPIHKLRSCDNYDPWDKRFDKFEYWRFVGVINSAWIKN